MFEKEEQQLHVVKEHYEQITIPPNIDDFIFNGIQKAKKAKKHIFYVKWGGMVAAILIIVFITSIRVSTAFAAYVSEIPGFEKMVELIRHDKGLMSAIENDFMQEINVSDEHDGIKVTIDSVIVDEAQMVVFYSIDSEHEGPKPKLSNINLTDNNRNNLKVSIGHSYTYEEDLNKHEITTNKINFMFVDQETIPESLILSAQIEEVSSKTWTFAFKIDKQKFAGLKKTREINQTATIAEQQIIFEKMAIFPTRIEIDMYFPNENKMEIFDFDDLRLVDEHGEQL